MNETFMEPITDADKIPKQRWKLVRWFIVSVLRSANISSTEMLGVRHTGRRMHPVQQVVLLSRVPCNLRSEGEVPYAYEVRPRLRCP